MYFKLFGAGRWCEDLPQMRDERFLEVPKYLLIHFHLKNAADCAGLPPRMAREFKN
ncbi:MAG: hypothetical protein LIO40_04435 [Ruminococcus sp.]|nr:hypothetical protein [Ruminococcus sp.]